MSDNNFPTVALTQILQSGLLPDATPPAPYLLLVDDARALADTLAGILRHEGYAVTVAYDAESALGIAQLAPPQLLVTDVCLPRMNGVELAFHVQALIPDCKVVLVTASPDLAAGLLATKPRRPWRLFEKPIRLSGFLVAVSELLVSTGDNDERFDSDVHDPDPQPRNAIAE